MATVAFFFDSMWLGGFLDLPSLLYMPCDAMTMELFLLGQTCSCVFYVTSQTSPFSWVVMDYTPAMSEFGIFISKTCKLFCSWNLQLLISMMEQVHVFCRVDNLHNSFYLLDMLIWCREVKLVLSMYSLDKFRLVAGNAQTWNGWKQFTCC
jgi:hypothetical protein